MFCNGRGVGSSPTKALGRQHIGSLQYASYMEAVLRDRANVPHLCNVCDVDR